MERRRLFLRILVPVLLAFIAAGGAAAEESPPGWSVSAAPSFTVPVGSDAELYSTGGEIDLALTYRLGGQLPLRLSAEAGHQLVPLARDTGQLSITRVGLGIGWQQVLQPELTLIPTLGGGYFFAGLNDGGSHPWAEGTGSNPWAGGGVELSYRFSPRFHAAVGASYRQCLGLCADAAVTLSAGYSFGPESTGRRPQREQLPVSPRPQPLTGSGLQIVSFEPEPLYPVFFSHYDDHPVGKAVIRNFEDEPAEEITVSLYVKQYMDNPKEVSLSGEMAPGDEAVVDLCGLFTSEILEVTEGKKVSLLLSLEYLRDGEKHTEEYVETVEVKGRNALTWDDDRKAAAFVTARDPAVMKVAKNVSGAIQGEKIANVDRNLQLGIALHEALDVMGLSYSVDPTTPYEELSAREQAVDFLQFPRQTLEFRAGDCDDLSVLYAALLESLGVESAFITIPGHIYSAFDLEMDSEEARSFFSRSDTLIFQNGRAWVPVEVTMRDKGFLAAWEEGAKQWREYRAVDKARLIPVHEAWRSYKPVGLPGSGNVSVPPRSEVSTAYSRQLRELTEREVQGRAAELRRKLEDRGDDSRLHNALGVLYARYGLADRARREFERTLQLRPGYYPALLNLGNLSHLQEEYEQALDYYGRAQKRAPDSPSVLLAVARVKHALENYYGAGKAYEKLQERSPELAERFSYLALRGEEAGRAADTQGVKGEVIWVKK